MTNPTNITFTAAASVANLEVTSVSASPNPVETAQNLTVNYSVQNAGNATAVSSWVDSVFLSSTAAINSSAVLLGRVTHTGTVAASGTYSGTLKAAVPAVAPGNYFIVVEVDSQGLVPDTDRAATVLATTSPVLVTIPSLTLGAAGGTPTPVTGTIDVGAPVIYAVADPNGSPFNINLTAGAIGNAGVLVGYQSIPTQASSVFSLQSTTSQGQNTVVSGLVQGGQAGTYYVVINWPGPASSAPYSLSASVVGLSVNLPVPPTAPAADDVTISLSGSGFTPGTEVSLVSGQTTIPAEQVVFQSAYACPPHSTSRASAVGDYAIKVSDNGQSASTAQSFAVFAPTRPPRSFTQDNSSIIASRRGAFRLSGPGMFIRSRSTTIAMPWRVITVQAPLLELSADNVEFELPGQTSFTPDSILLLGINPSGEAGLLPGTGSRQCSRADRSITVNFILTQPGTVQFNLGVADPTDTIDWSSLKSTLQPPGVSDAAWNAIFANFTAEVGNTMGGLQTALDNDANYLSQLGIYTPDVNQLLIHAARAGRRFRRDRGPQFARYLRPGHPRPDDDRHHRLAGERDIISGSNVRPFTLQPDGSYQGAPGDFATLTRDRWRLPDSRDRWHARRLQPERLTEFHRGTRRQ